MQEGGRCKRKKINWRSKKEPELEDLENTQLIHVVKKNESRLWRRLQVCCWTQRLGMWLVDLTTHLSRNSTILVWRGQSSDEMKEGCQTSGILPAGNGLMDLSGNEHVLTFKKGKNAPRAVQRPKGQAQEVSCLLLSARGQGHCLHSTWQKPASSSFSAPPLDFLLSVVSLPVTQVKNLSSVTPFLSLILNQASGPVDSSTLHNHYYG